MLNILIFASMTRFFILLKLWKHPQKSTVIQICRFNTMEVNNNAD